MKPIPLAPDHFPELRSALLAHYDREARDLPWRRDRDPYRVLVSEIMLQQTRVDTVVGYYDRWLERFPTVSSLADADEGEVMKAWEGLGYYRRARNLHGAAKAVRERPQGFPRSSDELRALPGVGEYTAGAVASIVFGEVTPAVDGNVRRVLARLYDEPDPKPAWLRERAAELVDRGRPGDWNQAVMELGATVCTPQGPRCETCPLSVWCAAREAGTAEKRPAARKAKVVPHGRFVLAVVEMGGQVLLQRRPAGGLLGGLWAFPEQRVPDEAGRLDGSGEEAVGGTAIGIAEGLGLRVEGEPVRLPAVSHRFSHLHATYLPVVLRVGPGAEGVASGGGWQADGIGEELEEVRPLRWIGPDDSEVALPVAQRKVLQAWHEARSSKEVACESRR
ncbi:MAG: A/G-specific adenine glycosylase [Gemmatimonadetes bacterium]|nr:A/G-specific adenine glycosylase [Gemmatimonadota bacterium]